MGVVCVPVNLEKSMIFHRNLLITSPEIKILTNGFFLELKQCMCVQFFFLDGTQTSWNHMKACAQESARFWEPPILGTRNHWFWEPPTSAEKHHFGKQFFFGVSSSTPSEVFVVKWSVAPRETVGRLRTKSVALGIFARAPKPGYLQPEIEVCPPNQSQFEANIIYKLFIKK